MRTSHEHLIRFMIDNLRDGADKEVALTMIMSHLDAAHSKGIEDAAWVCEHLAAATPKATAEVCAKALHELRRRNDIDHEHTIHSW